MMNDAKAAPREIELYSEVGGSPRLFKLEGSEGIGIEFDGKVCIHPLAEWHRLSWSTIPASGPLTGDTPITDSAGLWLMAQGPLPEGWKCPPEQEDDIRQFDHELLGPCTEWKVVTAAVARRLERKVRCWMKIADQRAIEVADLKTAPSATPRVTDLLRSREIFREAFAHISMHMNEHGAHGYLMPRSEWDNHLCGILEHWRKEFFDSPIMWPRTWYGWKRLFWIFINRCPVDHTPLLTDPWTGGDTLFCFKCDGVSMWPANIVIALRGNHRAAQIKAASLPVANRRTKP